MPEANATILIPDISGFTEFMTTTELEHGSHAINILLDSIINAVGDEYEVSEVEGDAVLMFKRGPAPSKKDIQAICLRIFNAFHYQRKWMQQHVICPCGACQAIINLTLKFVTHYGPVGEMKVGRFVTLSGTDVIVAHRLMKNSIPSNEYMLLTEKLWRNLPDAHEPSELEWKNLSDEFASIGKIDYRFAHLEPVRKMIPDPPPPDNYYLTDNISSLELSIAANFRDTYMVVMNIPGRTEWVPGLQKVEQDTPTAFVGSVHRLTFEKIKAIVSPLQMTLTNEGVFYAESFRLPELNISLVYEYVFKRINDTTTNFAIRFLNTTETPVPDDTNQMLFEQLKQMAEKLKEYCEKTELAFFK